MREPLVIAVSPPTPYRPINQMWADLTAALRAAGCHAMSYTPRNDEADMLQDMQQVLQDLVLWKGPRLILSCNGSFLPPVEKQNGRLVSFGERYNVPLWTLMIDEPARHSPRLRAAPESSFVTIVDEQHRRYVEEAGLGRKGIAFFGHGGPEPLADPTPTSERAPNQVFIGDVTAPPPYEEWLGRISQDTAIQEVVDRVVTRCLDPQCRHCSHLVLEAVCAETGQALSANMRDRVIAHVEIYIHQRRRLEILEGIREHSIDIFGQVTPDAAPRLQHHRLHGKASWARGIEAMRAARFVLNPVAVFKTGGHPRLTYGLANGCLPFTTPTRFCEGITDRGGVDFDLLGDGGDDERLAAAHAARDIDDIQRAMIEAYAGRHSWGQRVDSVRHIAETLAES